MHMQTLWHFQVNGLVAPIFIMYSTCETLIEQINWFGESDKCCKLIYCLCICFPKYLCLFISFFVFIPYLLLSYRSLNLFLLLFFIEPQHLARYLLSTMSLAMSVLLNKAWAQGGFENWSAVHPYQTFLACFWLMPPSPFSARQCPRVVCGGPLRAIPSTGYATDLSLHTLHSSWDQWQCQ